MKGTKTFELPISIDDHSRSGGVVQNDLAREVTQTARLAGLNLLPVNTIAPDHFTSFTPSLGIRLNTKKAFNVCATSLELMASTIQNVIIENTGQKGLALVVLWQQHSLEVGHVIDRQMELLS